MILWLYYAVYKNVKYFAHRKVEKEMHYFFYGLRL